jgi:hypothetical protein
VEFSNDYGTIGTTSDNKYVGQSALHTGITKEAARIKNTAARYRQYTSSTPTHASGSGGDRFGCTCYVHDTAHKGNK